jgi:tetratricopeptide (TPR) repeat protein
MRKYRLVDCDLPCFGLKVLILCWGVALAGSDCRAADPPDAAALFRAGKYAESVEAATLALVDTPASERLNVLKLRAQLELGRYAEALVTLDEALKANASSLQLRWVGREVCRFNGQVERAEQLEKEMVELNQRAPWLFSDATNQVVVGRVMLSQKGDPKKVLGTVFNEAKRRQPGNVDVLLATGELAL